MLQPHLHSAFTRPNPGPGTPAGAQALGHSCLLNSLPNGMFGMGHVTCSGFFGSRASAAAGLCPHPPFHPLFPPLSLPSLAVSSWQAQFSAMASPDATPLSSFYWSSGCSMSPPLAMSCPAPSPMLPPLTQRPLSAATYLPTKSPVCPPLPTPVPPSYKEPGSHRVKREEPTIPSPRHMLEELGPPMTLPKLREIERHSEHSAKDDKYDDDEDEEVDILGPPSEPQDLSLRACPSVIDCQDLTLRPATLPPMGDPNSSPGLPVPRFQPTTRVYTLKTFFQSDGRSKRSSGASDSCPLVVPNALNPRLVDASANSSLGSTSGSVSVSGEKRLPTCDICGKRYATQSNLSRHKQTHLSLDSPRAKECPHCGKRYVSSAAFSMHLSTHEKQFKCDVCHRPFSRRWLLMGHMRTHSGEKPYGCAHCGKAFADRSNLRAHMGTHANVKKHACERCGKRFAIKAYLNKHRESSCLKAD